MWRIVLCALAIPLLPLQAQNLVRVKQDVLALTDSALHGRGYVHDGSNKAAHYLAGRFREIGIAPIDTGYFQPFVLSVNAYPQPTGLSFNKRALREGHDYITDAWSGVSEGTFTLQYFDSTHFQGNGMPTLRKGRIPAVYLQGIESPDEASALHEFKQVALARGPVLLINPKKLTWGVGQRRYKHALIEVDAASFPERVKKLKLKVTPEQIDYTALNVVGKIAGARSDSCLVITAHYDHLGRLGRALFSGASDNASGTATMLDLASYFVEHEPPMDMYFIAFAAEEAGLLGSKYFVDNPLVPLETMRFLINLDLMGSAAEGITIVNGRLYEEEVGRMGAINKAEAYVPKIKLRGKAANSDHYWFAEAGVPAIFIYTEGNVKAYHDVMDTPEALDWANYEGLFTLLRTFIQTF